MSSATLHLIDGDYGGYEYAVNGFSLPNPNKVLRTVTKSAKSAQKALANTAKSTIKAAKKNPLAAAALLGAAGVGPLAAKKATGIKAVAKNPVKAIATNPVKTVGTVAKAAGKAYVKPVKDASALLSSRSDGFKPPVTVIAANSKRVKKDIKSAQKILNNTAKSTIKAAKKNPLVAAALLGAAGVGPLAAKKATGINAVAKNPVKALTTNPLKTVGTVAKAVGQAHIDVVKGVVSQVPVVGSVAKGLGLVKAKANPTEKVVKAAKTVKAVQDQKKIQAAQKNTGLSDLGQMTSVADNQASGEVMRQWMYFAGGIALVGAGLMIWQAYNE